MKAVVTGGLGFIGGAVCVALARRGWDVVTIDPNVTTAAWQPADLDHAYGAINGDRHAIVAAAVEVAAYGTGLEQVLDRVDVVVHCASPVGPGALASMRGDVLPSMMSSALAAATIAQRSGAAIVNVSSSEAFGGGVGVVASTPARIPAGYNVRREYAVGKLAVEQAFGGMAAAGTIRAVTSVRPFNIAGPRQRADLGFVVPRFVRAALDDDALLVYTPTSRRAFLHVADLAGLLADLADHLAVGGHVAEVVTAGNPGNLTTIAALAERVVARVGGGEPVIADPADEWGAGFAHPDGGEKAPLYATTVGPVDGLAADENAGLMQPTRTLDDIIDDTARHLRDADPGG